MFLGLSDIDLSRFILSDVLLSFSKLNSGFVPIYEPGIEELVKRNKAQKRLNFSSNISDSIKKSDIIFICVGTPTNKKNNSADLKYVFQVAKTIRKNIHKCSAKRYILVCRLYCF